jgi:peroxiredoxin
VVENLLPWTTAKATEVTAIYTHSSNKDFLKCPMLDTPVCLTEDEKINKTMQIHGVHWGTW